MARRLPTVNILKHEKQSNENTTPYVSLIILPQLTDFVKLLDEKKTVDMPRYCPKKSLYKLRKEVMATEPRVTASSSLLYYTNFSNKCQLF